MVRWQFRRLKAFVSRRFRKLRELHPVVSVESLSTNGRGDDLFHNCVIVPAAGSDVANPYFFFGKRTMDTHGTIFERGPAAPIRSEALHGDDRM